MLARRGDLLLIATSCHFEAMKSAKSAPRSFALRSTLSLALLAAASVACGSGVDAGARGGGPARDAAEAGLPRRHDFDPVRASRGEEALRTARGAEVPWRALRSLWVVWGRLGLDDAEYWAELSDRYGFVPRGGSEPPYGIVRDGELGNVQCLACHVDQVAGTPRVGAGNGRLRLSALYDDLIELSEVAASYGIVVPPIPEVWHEAFADRTGAAGATDATGMGMTLATAYAPGSGIETHYGFQQSPAWWSLAYKDRAYVDGAGSSQNFRTMLATTLASGATLSDLMAMEGSFEDIRHYMLSLRAPAWPFTPPSVGAVEQGRAVFEERCAGCHGAYGVGADYPDLVVDVSTDPMRHQRFTGVEAAWINASWFGRPPMEDTEGYLAPPLLGVWATAPYLHNGSVPDLRSLLRPEERPLRWRRVAAGPDDYDPVRVGVRFEPGNAGDPWTYDTTTPGLSAEGHDFGADLTDGEVDALLAYLVTL